MLGLDRLKSGNRNDPAVARHLYATPRHKVGAAIRDQVHAMIDISDGFSTDLTHILEESKVSARIYKDRLPRWPGADDRHVLHGGEEYEVIIAAPDLPKAILDVPLTQIGEIIDSQTEHEIFLIDATSELVLKPQGWQHF